MTPEEHYICALMGMSRWEKREKVAEFRRSLVERDMRVLEDYLYSSEDNSEWVSEYRAAERTTLSQKNEEIPAFADTSTCSGCGEEYPTDELYDEFSEDGDAMFVVCQDCSTTEGMKRPRVEDR